MMRWADLSTLCMRDSAPGEARSKIVQVIPPQSPPLKNHLWELVYNCTHACRCSDLFNFSLVVQSPGKGNVKLIYLEARALYIIFSSAFEDLVLRENNRLFHFGSPTRLCSLFWMSIGNSVLTNNDLQPALPTLGCEIYQLHSPGSQIILKKRRWSALKGNCEKH